MGVKCAKPLAVKKTLGNTSATVMRDLKLPSGDSWNTGAFSAE